MLDGRMRHKDNHGNEGVLVPGSVQWMTAGRGLVHSEMPEQQAGPHAWLPAVAEPASAREDDRAEVPGIRAGAHPDGGPRTRGHREGHRRQCGGLVGPILQPATDPTYLDLTLEPKAEFVQALPPDYAAFLYVFEGEVTVG